MLDVGHHDFLVEVIEQVVKVTRIELERLVGRAGHVVKVLAAARLGGLVERAVQDEHGQGDQRELLLQPLVGAYHHRDASPSGLCGNVHHRAAAIDQRSIYFASGAGP